MKENKEEADTNVGDIEEAIERLEYIDRTYSYNNYYSIWDLKCIEILLSDYKRVLKENEELLEVKVSASAHNRILELEKENEELKNQEATQKKINELLVQRYSNSISLQKVKDKIRHYQELQDNYIKKYDEINDGLQAMINVLQELIEKER